MSRLLIVILALFLLVSRVAVAEDFSLQFPVDCQLNESCFIPLYADDDPSEEYRDFQGGMLSYDDHKGTDVALVDYPTMDQGVNVLAAQAGRVLRIRNDQVDHRGKDFEVPEGKACGNGVVIEHQDGWVSQYCHLKQGSVVVTPGEAVKQGQVIGQIGSSGHTTFPHLHFQLTHERQIVDPFKAKLWQPAVDYQASGLIAMGFSDHTVTHKELVNDPPNRTKFSLFEPAVVAWVRVFGVQAGDEQKFIFYQPDGKIYRQPIENTIPEDYKVWYAYAGFPIINKIPNTLAGTWKVEYQLKHKDQDWQTLGERRFVLDF